MTGGGAATGTSAPRMGRTPADRHACVKRTAAETPRWSVSATVPMPAPAAAAASSAGRIAPSRNEKHECVWRCTKAIPPV